MKSKIPPRLIYRRTALKILDQRALPWKIRYVPAKNAASAAKAVKDMVLRGAPLIGCAAAYGCALEIRNFRGSSWKSLEKASERAAEVLNASRPTAFALFAATARMSAAAREFIHRNKSKKFRKSFARALAVKLEKEAGKIVLEDIRSNLAIAKNGASLLKKNSSVITHCNAGALATMGMGTAVGVIIRAAGMKKIRSVYVSETRPYLQGARLTLWELCREKIHSELICDNMAGYIMKTRKIDAVIVGADRIAANGDTANKIGTYQLAVLARYHKIPFYAAAPSATIDFSLKTGAGIEIENRSPEEVTRVNGRLIAHKNAKALHPAFDVTPRSMITALITEKGVFRPGEKGFARAFKRNRRKPAQK